MILLFLYLYIYPRLIQSVLCSCVHTLYYSIQLALNSKETVKHEDQLGVGKMGVLGGVMEALEGVGYKSLHLYEDEIRGFESRSFIVALKAYASRADWYINEAELEIRLHERISRAATMKFFDVQSMLKYQLPSKAAELVYCRSGNKDRKEDKCKSRGFDTDFAKLSSVSVGKSTMGEYAGKDYLLQKTYQRVELLVQIQLGTATSFSRLLMT